MKSHKCGPWLRTGSLAVFVIAALSLVTPVAGAQTYAFGREDFQAGTNPWGVAVADFNGDGRTDVAVTNLQNNQITILLGSATGGFVESGTYATGSYPTVVVAADFNGDKKPDLAVLDAQAGTISILLGNGNGTFQSRVDYAVGESPVGLVAGDFDGDGKVDLATISTSDSAVAVLLGNGDGSFEVQALISVASEPTLLAGGDVNGDGKTDLITCNNNYETGTITVLVSKGKGSFTQVNSQAPPFGETLAVGDVNGDGKLDAIIEGNIGLYVSLGNGDGTFQNPVAISNTPQLEFGDALLVGDFNHDGKLDLALSGVLVMLGKGDGTFQNPILSFAEATPMAVVDVNGDGEPDLVTVDNAYNSVAVPILLGNGDGSFMDLRVVPVASSPYYESSAVAADLNGDGKLDLAVAEPNYPNGQVSVQLGNGNGTFRKPIVSSLTTNATSPGLMLAADFNGDGRSDLVVLDNNNAGFQVLLGRGDGKFKAPVDNPLSYSASWFATGDFNKDGKDDLVVVNGNSYGPSINVYLSRGNGTFSAGAQYVVYSDSYVVVADVNGDDNLDLVVVGPNYGSGSNLLVFLGNGDGTFKNPLFGPSDIYYSQPVTGDFNGDGKLDVVVGTSSGIAFLAGNGDGTFQAQVYSDPALQLSGPLNASNFTGNGKLSLVGRNYNGAGPLLVSGNGDGTFGPATEYDAGSYGNEENVAAGDFNSDGTSDLAIPGESPTSNTPGVFLYLSTTRPNLQPTALNFGGEQVGKTSSAKKVRLTNVGNAELKISSITVSGDFLEQNNCGKYVVVGRTCTIQISFKPTAKGNRTGQVSINDNAPGRTQNVALKGVGQ
jgi:hypothetical protein